MRKHFYKECVNPECKSKSDKTLGNIWGDPLHDIIVEDGRQFAKCSICGADEYFRDPDQKYKMRYPLYNASLDKTFSTRDEEKKYAKANNLTEVGPGQRMRDLRY